MFNVCQHPIHELQGTVMNGKLNLSLFAPYPGNVIVIVMDFILIRAL